LSVPSWNGGIVSDTEGVQPQFEFRRICEKVLGKYWYLLSGRFLASCMGFNNNHSRSPGKETDSWNLRNPFSICYKISSRSSPNRLSERSCKVTMAGSYLIAAGEHLLFKSRLVSESLKSHLPIADFTTFSGSIFTFP
jgi:hypothetical protein